MLMKQGCLFSDQDHQMDAVNTTSSALPGWCFSSHTRKHIVLRNKHAGWFTCWDLKWALMVSGWVPCRGFVYILKALENHLIFRALFQGRESPWKFIARLNGNDEEECQRKRGVHVVQGHNIRRLRRSLVKWRMPYEVWFNIILLFYLILGKLDLVHLEPV